MLFNYINSQIFIVFLKDIRLKPKYVTFYVILLNMYAILKSIKKNVGKNVYEGKRCIKF
jgi:hypothetical protein